jgi:hypothetical protein
MAHNLSPQTRVVADKYSCLGGPGDPLRYPDQPSIHEIRITLPKYAGDIANSPEALAASGVEYVAVVETAYDLFFAPGVTNSLHDDGIRVRRERFYADLFARGELVWSYSPSPNSHGFTDPELRLYRISGLRK